MKRGGRGLPRSTACLHSSAREEARMELGSSVPLRVASQSRSETSLSIGMSIAMPQRKYTLTESGRRLLLERYDGRPQTIVALMELFPGIPRWKIKQWAAYLGVARMKEPRLYTWRGTVPGDALAPHVIAIHRKTPGTHAHRCSGQVQAARSEEVGRGVHHERPLPRLRGRSPGGRALD